jgi:hypothetical protein
MKTKSLKLRLSYFFTPRIHSNVLAWVKPASESERSNHAIGNILRWEDDGGKIIENHHLVFDPPFVQSVPINGAMHNASRPWKQHFFIEPFQPGAGSGLRKRNASIEK